MGLKRYLYAAVAFAAMTLGLAGCGHEENWDGEYDKVLILYSAGFNSLSEYMSGDLEDLRNGWLPSKKSHDILLVISKLTESAGDYADQTEPVMFRIYKKSKGQGAVLDTLFRKEKGTLLASSEVMREFLTEAKTLFPAKSYGMVLSSHGTGWMPSYYFSNPEKYDGQNISLWSAGEKDPQRGGHLYVEPDRDPSLPAVKSVTQEVYVSDNKRYSCEMDIQDFASAFPMHMDYIIFDVCLMGGIEVAWELRDVADKLGFCQSETLAEGFDYQNLTERLLRPVTPEPEKVCSDYYETYNAKSDIYRWATISCVDCTNLEPVAEVCRTLFEKYRAQIASLNGNRVQAYFYNNDKHWHYDLYDILAKAGADESELASLQAALDGCVLYNEATPYIYTQKIDTHCGFSMYLPSMGSSYLDSFYRTLAWNKATELVSDTQ